MQQARKLNRIYLLSVYMIIPICIVMLLLDQLVLDGFFRSHLPTRPEEWAWWLVIFNTPHIISSFVTILNTEDMRDNGKSYKNIILLLLAISLTIYGIFPLVLSGQAKYQFDILVFAIYGFFTLHHVFSQQFGMSLILGRFPPSPSMKAFKYLAISLSVLLLLHLGLDANGKPFYSYMLYCEITLAALVLFFSLSYFNRSRSWLANTYHIGNVLMVLSSFIFVNLGYGIFALIIPRVIHDLTAFMIYSNHDENRFNISNKSHYIYSFTNKYKLRPLYLSFCIGILVAYLLNLLPITYLIFVLLVVDFFHYYIERHIWKSDGNHRNHLKIS